MNWAEPAKTMEDMACAAAVESPEVMASAPKIMPNGTTPRRMGDSSRTPLQNSNRRNAVSIALPVGP